ncbi:MAG: cytochrome c [Vicinamibacterales bacterium]
MRPAWRLVLLVAIASTACGNPPSAGGPQAATGGRELYASNGCAVCHGSEGRGDGPVAAGTTPRPTDFTKPESFKTARTVDAVATVIADGIPSTPRPMPPYRHLDEGARRLIAEYVLSLGDQGSRR